MATNVQRWGSLCDSLLNKTTTVAQKTRLGDAVAAATPAASGGYATWTADAKAGYCLAVAKRVFVDWVKAADKAAPVVGVDEAVDAEFADGQ